MPLLSAGVAFFSFLSIFPAMIAAVLLYGLVADPADIHKQAQDVADALPNSARDLLLQQVDKLSSSSQGSLGLGLIITVALSLWSASGGMGYLITAINMAYDEEETRGFVKRKGLALLLTIGMIVFGLAMVALVAIAPAVFDALDFAAPLRALLELGRWLLLLVAIMVGLAAIYRLAPDRSSARLKWVSTGAVVATIMWLIASFAFSLYVDNFGSYGKTYGSLASVVVLLLWLWISFYVVLLGAEINAESEEQTVRDTTTGPEQPLGERGAVKADSVPPEK